MASNADHKQAVLDSDPSDWRTDDAPDSFAYPNHDITLERIGDWTPASAPWEEWTAGDTLRRAKYRLYYDGAPFDQLDFLALDDGTLLPMPDYLPPQEKPDAMPNEYVLTLSRYQDALGRIATDGDFETARDNVGVVVRDEEEGAVSA